MPPLTWLAAVVGAAAFARLVIAAHRGARPWRRAALALAAAAALSAALTGSLLSLAFFAAGALLVIGTWRAAGARWWWAWVAVLVAVLVGAKLPAALSARGPAGAASGLGPALWLGVSYLIFRLIHVTVDVHMGRTGRPPLPDLLAYALHPASLVAGPIGRVQADIAAHAEPAPFRDDLHAGLWRILRGAALKFVIANPLYGVVRLHDMARNPDRPVSAAWVWLLAYTFYLLADFAAYSDLAIGFGRLAGLRLPENFERPYLAPTLTAFWQRWHISLSTWLRDYIFFPLARGLRRRLDPRRRDAIQLVAHATTMVAAGLWHGMTPSFALWGLWHGLGLFAWSQAAARGPRRPSEPGWRGALKQAPGVALTFLFVMLGWVWFAADLPTALRIYARLFGVR